MSQTLKNTDLELSVGDTPGASSSSSPFVLPKPTVSSFSITKESTVQVKLTQDEEDYHRCKAAMAKEVLKKVLRKDDLEDSEEEQTLEPPETRVTESHFHRRAAANIALAAVEDYMSEGVVPDAADLLVRTKAQRKTWSSSGLSGVQRKVSFYNEDELEDLHKSVALSVKQMVKGLSEDSQQTLARARKNSAASGSLNNTVSTLQQLSQKHRTKSASALHDEVEHLLKTGGTELSRLTPLSHEKPVLKDPLGIQCVSHLKEKKWTVLARAIRETIYDPDFYDDGTYGPMYVRLAIHGAANWNQHDKSGGLEGGAMRFRPEYSDAHNKFCKHIVKRQHDLIKVPFPWASYADIQCLCSYVAIECAGGPVMEFSPGRRDVAPYQDDFAYLNYHERGDVGPENAFVPNLKYNGQYETVECPFLKKMKVMPGRLPGPEEGHLGLPIQPVTPEMERKELKAVAHKIRKIFLDVIGTTEQYTVALIAGGHSFGRCHPEISGYAGPWQSNPGYFNNVYCKKLLSEDWKLVDRTMEDCSGDMITGLKPLGMRRQYVNKGGKGDLMMLVSDMALREDAEFGKWIKIYANDLGKLKEDFAVAFKWITEVGFEKPQERTGLAKRVFDARVSVDDFLRWLGSKVCMPRDDDAGRAGAAGSIQEDAPKVGNPYTMEDVAKHTTPNDVWCVINNKVCDLSKFKNEHPGGVPVIMESAGKDVSEQWNAIHNRSTIEKLAPQVVVGYLK